MTQEKTTHTSKKTKWLIVIGALALVAIAIFLWAKHTARRSPSVAGVSSAMMQSDTTAMVSLTSEAMTRAGIDAQPVETKSFSSMVSAVGIIEIPDPALRTISVRARGRIERMFVSSTGTYVRKGEPLFELYSPDILSAEKEYLVAAQVGEMDQATMAQNPGMGHHADPGLVKAGMERLLLYGLTAEQIRQLSEHHTVSNTVTITSPMDGVILQKLSQEGAYVDEGTSIFQLADLSSVWAEINMPEADIRFVRMGQMVRIEASAYPDEQFAGRVILISPVEDQVSRTIRVRLALPNSAGKLRPEMTFTATIPIAAGSALAIPQAAVVRTGTADYVWTSDSNNMFTRRAVTLGMLSSDHYYQVLAGLSPGDNVAVNGAFLIDAEHEFTKSNPMAGMNMGETGNKNSGVGTATVRAINMQQGTITLDHSAVPGVMPPMTMGYKVSDPKFLQSVKVNESVRFTLAHSSNGGYIITAIEQQ